MPKCIMKTNKPSVSSVVAISSQALIVLFKIVQEGSTKKTCTTITSYVQHVYPMNRSHQPKLILQLIIWIIIRAQNTF